MSEDMRVTAAFHAVIRKIQLGAVFKDLSKIRAETMKKTLNARAFVCECQGESLYNDVNAFRPVWLESTNRHVIRALPLNYVTWTFREGFIPHYHIIELPDIEGLATFGSLDEVEESFANRYSPVVINSEPKTFWESNLWLIRMRTTQELARVTKQELPVYLSVLNCERIPSLANLLGPYRKILETNQLSSLFERDKTRVIPVTVQGEVFAFEFDTYAIRFSEMAGLARANGKVVSLER